MAPSLWQETFDEASQCTYYYHVETGETSWTLPADADEDAVAHDHDGDISYMALAAVRLQAHFRGHRARCRVARLLRVRYQTTLDPESRQTLYTDRRSGVPSWTQPALYARLVNQGNDDEVLDEENQDDDDDDDDDDADLLELDALQQADDAVSDDGAIAAAQAENNDDGESGMTEKMRKFPRSTAQQRVDAAEDQAGGQAPVLHLDLSALDAWRLSSRIWNLTALTSLSLARNQLTRIPSGIQDLVLLERLDLSHNRLTRLPSCLQTTATLRFLDASHNRIAAFSPKLWKLRALRELRLAHNALADVPFVEGDLTLLRDTREWQVGVGLLTQLTLLDLSHNRLTAVPKSIAKCAALRVLRLSHNKLQSLSDELCEVEALAEVHVDGNALVELPEAIGSLVNLITLVASGNRLSALPESIGNLQSLVEISLQHNQIHHLPDEFGALGGLKWIHLDANVHLATVASCLRLLPAVESFSASKCGLVAFDAVDVLSKAPVERLCLRDNALVNLPLSFERSAMKMTLQQLDLARNALQQFPPEIVSAPCAALVRLDLSHNRLRAVPSDISTLRALRTLMLSHNQLGPLLPEAVAWLPHLVELRCDHNRLEKLPLAIGILKKLQHVDVSANLIRALPSSFLDLSRSLQSLIVRDNLLTRAPPVVALLAPSCFVDLSNNPFCSDGAADGDAATGAVVDRSRRLYASAVRHFDQREYDAADELLTTSLALLDRDDDNVQGGAWWLVRQQQLPEQLYLRALCRYMMLKQTRSAIDDMSIKIDESERLAHGDALLRLRSVYRPVLAGENEPRGRSSNKLTLAAVGENDRPEREEENEPSNDPKAPPGGALSNQENHDDPTIRSLETALRQRTKARARAAAATSGALSDLDRTIRLGVSELPTAYYIQGHLHMETLDFAQAIESFTRALRRVNTDEAAPPSLASVPILMARAEAYRRLGQLPSALTDVQRVLDGRPVDSPAEAHAQAETLAHEWDVQQAQYFVDHDSLFRTFDVASASGVARRPEVHDAHAVLSAHQREELKLKTPSQRFDARVVSLVADHARRSQTTRLAMDNSLRKKTLVLQRARNFKREVRENLVMEMAEHAQRVVETELARLAELQRQELDREFNERIFMKYEDEYMKWLVSEERRLDAENSRREDATRRKAETKAQFEMRLARRGGRRQQLAFRGAQATRKTSVAGAMAPSSKGSGGP